MTLFRPATGQVRAKGVTSAPNAVLHPWLQAELERVLAALPPVTEPEDARPLLGTVGDLAGPLPLRPTADGAAAPDPLLIWDNLAGHLSAQFVLWLYQHGVLPLYTPLSGSWLNLAESLQRILVRRALAGQHPHTPEEIITWLEATVAGWNADPTPFTWGGKRAERRQRARVRRHQRLAGSGAQCFYPSSLAR